MDFKQLHHNMSTTQHVVSVVTCIAPWMVQTTLKSSGMDRTDFNLQRTPRLLYLVSVHQMAPPLNVVANI